MLLHRLQKDNLVQPPKWLPDNTAMLCAMGSVAYGVSGTMSDVDCYGFCLPPKELVFPHLGGEIPGFGTQKQRFEVWQQHHINDRSAGKEYDFSVYSIVRYLHLVMENNPNMVDSLFVPERCILHTTPIADLIRERRREFLHRGSYHRFRGYAYQQLKKVQHIRTDDESVKNAWAFEVEHGIDHKTSYDDVVEEMAAREKGGTKGTIVLSDASLAAYHSVLKTIVMKNKRLLAVKQYGFDVKFAYHIVRLALEAEQILLKHDLDLECNSEILKAIRNGEWTLKRLEDWFSDKEKQLEHAYSVSTLRIQPDEENIKSLLLQCMEIHYGRLEKAVVRQTSIDDLKAQMTALIERF